MAGINGVGTINPPSLLLNPGGGPAAGGAEDVGPINPPQMLLNPGSTPADSTVTTAPGGDNDSFSPSPETSEPAPQTSEAPSGGDPPVVSGLNENFGGGEA